MKLINCAWRGLASLKAAFVLLATMAIALPAQTFNTLFSFDSSDGANPSAGLLQGINGNFYGTVQGGAYGGGTIFRLTPSGALTTLHAFREGSEFAEGSSPRSVLVESADGNLYGTTAEGGISQFSCVSGCGTVFKFSPSGTLTTLHAFCFQVFQASCPDGDDPSGLVLGSDGNLYGTTWGGGLNGFGTVFKITTSGTLTTLYSFCSQGGYPACTDGESPSSGLVQAANGDFYGTASGGGNTSASCFSGCGTVFKISPSGALTTLHRFTGADGGNPGAALIQAADGNFYGTTDYGGTAGTDCYQFCGTVFRITSSGALTTLHNFSGADGGNPIAALVEGGDEYFYGTTSAGGVSGGQCPTEGCGTVFKISPAGVLTTLHSFAGTDGYYPVGALLQDTNGEFYGTTWQGGSGYGTIFSLSVGLSPFVKTQPSAGKVGAVVEVLGTGLTGATSVTFNGTAAAFRVVSSSLIITSVPSGASSGTVQVAGPSGTLSSIMPFTVHP